MLPLDTGLDAGWKPGAGWMLVGFQKLLVANWWDSCTSGIGPMTYSLCSVAQTTQDQREA
jgi:hypothetical protein